MPPIYDPNPMQRNTAVWGTWQNNQLGFFPGFDKIVQVGTQVVGRVIGGGGSDAQKLDDQMIAWQGQVYRQWDMLMNDFRNKRQQGTLTLPYIKALKNQVQTIADNYLAFNRTVGTARAKAGEFDVTRDLQMNLNEINFEETKLNLSPTVTDIPYLPELSSVSPSTFLLGGAALLLLMRRKK